MYNYKKTQPTTLKVNKSYEGETIEHKVDRILNDKEPITDGAPQIWTERKDGVNPNYNPRTDRWEYAVEAYDTLSRSNQARRKDRIDAQMKTKPENKDNGGPEPTPTTDKK